MKQWIGLFVSVVGLTTGMVAWAAPDDQQAVQARSEQLWAAEVGKNWGAVYDLLTPSGREGQTRDEYAANRETVGPLHYVEAKVDQVYVAAEVAWVHVNYKFVIVAMPLVTPKSAEFWQVWRKAGEWQATGPDERAAWPRLPPQLRSADEEAALAKRANEMWQARVARDFKTIYGYLDPDYQAHVPLDEFLTRKSKYLYFKPRIDWTEVGGGGGGRVKVLFANKPADVAASKMEPRDDVLVEKWRKVGNEWYFDVMANGQQQQ